ncbi:ribosome small subunit-dependent GTPase A [Feifania hominis]|uniref:Small ribosomal subunit biogenesis GTPase RsgA n=1 Tax=Feifania hominis TaxID=2763660 RepID=A0A926DF36_9FIRM|nr:ribosome small subunit-dependent GTPase A [Feifania hominis]MBC8536983.1 ribosome small subunit-dependent GTPase A [Feifania hominis]
MTGRVVKGIGGFYYVQTDGGVYCCRARGRFRKDSVSPAVGDRVEISVVDEAAREGALERIEPRRNFLIRPPIANIDVMLIIAAAANPAPSTLLIDKLVAICEKKNITPCVCINKTDLADGEELCRIYRDIGYEALAVSAATGEGIDRLRTVIEGRVCAFSGNSGVGKSSLLNALDASFAAQTGELSAKIERGRHTTRHVELFALAGGWIADTPGFGDISIERFETVYKEELPGCFAELGQYEGQCRFLGCAHDREPGCAVKRAVETGEMARSRYESYLSMYHEVKDIKEWERR